MVRYVKDGKGYPATKENAKTEIGQMAIEDGQLFRVWFNYMTEVQTDFEKLAFEDDKMHLHTHEQFWEFIKNLAEIKLDKERY